MGVVLTVVRECIGGMQPVIMLDRNNALLHAVPKVFGQKRHAYCIRHLRENFLTAVGKYGFRRKVTNDLLKAMFNHEAYAPSSVEYSIAMDEMQKFKPELVEWVEKNEPERWVQSKFTKERWGRLNNNAIESWNNWMRSLRTMTIPWLVIGHLQKLGLKYDKRKLEFKKWKNRVGPRVEKL